MGPGCASSCSYRAAGESPEWIARQLGHTTTEMLFRVYSRYVPNLTRRDGSAFERLITQTLAERLQVPAYPRPERDALHAGAEEESDDD